MAFIHAAYTFNSKLAHQQLSSLIVEEEIVFPLRLQEIAQEMMKEPSVQLRRILSNFRYGDRWLLDDDDEQSNTYLWYIIYIANFFQYAPSLSNNRLRGSHFVLEKILPKVGWTTSEVRLLLFGKPVEDLMSDTGFPLLTGLNLDSGCLYGDDLEQLKSKLIATQHTFIISGDTAKEIKYLAGDNSWERGNKLVAMAFADGIDMLSATEKHGDALYLYRD
jgi:hypothetical protein